MSIIDEDKNLKIKRPKVKCIVWDLDNTIWDGILLEDRNVKLKTEIVDIIKELDNRGVLNSIASINEYNMAMEKLEEFGINEYFIYPQINWNSKSSSIKTIANLINIGIDTIAFVDDQDFERDEVQFSIPEILCINPLNSYEILSMPEMNPRFITEDSKLRRKMYMGDIERNKLEKTFIGTKEEFLASLKLKFFISEVKEDDLKRAEELTIRTHQLNSTGYTYSYEELEKLSKSDRHKLFIASLEDIYGAYGKIGLVLVECEQKIWTIKLILMSCRVMSRGVGTVLINYIMKLAKDENVVLRAEFVPTDRNRIMYITYKFAGFKEIQESDNLILFENDLTHIQPFPEFINITY